MNNETTKQDGTLRSTLARVKHPDTVFSFFVYLTPKGVIEKSDIPGLKTFTRSKSEPTLAIGRGTRQAVEALDKHPSVVQLKGSTTYAPM